MTAIATLSSKFQISIPKSARDAKGWQPGQKPVFLPRDGGFILVPVPAADELAGSAMGANWEGYRDRVVRD